MKHETQNNKKKFGFSIIEVMAAITIIVIGLVGVLALVNQNIQAQVINRNMLIASQLAQEGLELVRNKRDTNWLISGNDWKLGAGAGFSSDIAQVGGNGSYTIDYSGSINSTVDSIDENDAKLNIDASGFYSHTAGAPSLFYRLITVQNAGEWVEVDSQVRWKERGGTKDYTASTLLYNWR